MKDKSFVAAYDNGFWNGILLGLPVGFILGSIAASYLL
jgi:hypothetical protein